MRKPMKSLTVRLLLSLVLMAQLMVFVPTTKASGRFATSQCTGTLTLTGRAGTITRAISFIVFGVVNGPFSLSYSAVIQGFTYSASASGNCVPR